MYFKVASSSTVLLPSQASLIGHVNQEWLKIDKHLQPWIHEVDPLLTTSIEESIHGDLPKTGELWLSLAQAESVIKAIVCHPMVKGIRPVSIRETCVNGNRGSRTRVICKASTSQRLQGVSRKIQIWCSEASHFLKRNPSECVKSYEVAINFLVGWHTDMGHATKTVS